MNNRVRPGHVSLRVRLFAVSVFVAADTAIDRLLATRSDTLHHQRSLITFLLAGFFAIYASRGTLTPLRQWGVTLAVAGTAANAACALTDPAGVSDYLYLTLGHTMIVANLADVTILAGLTAFTASILTPPAHRLAHAETGHRSVTDADPHPPSQLALDAVCGGKTTPRVDSSKPAAMKGNHQAAPHG
jgi:hypothetical protein